MLKVEALGRQLMKDECAPLVLLIFLVYPILDLHHLHLEFIGLELHEGFKRIILEL